MPKISEARFSKKDFVKKAYPPVREFVPDAAKPEPEPDLAPPPVVCNLEEIDFDNLSEEDLDSVLSQIKRDALSILHQHLNKIKEGNTLLNEKSFRSMQQMFDSLWKQERAKDELLLKRRKEGRVDAMAIFDIYGRFGVPDETTIKSMRQALYGPDFNPKLVAAGSPEKVDGSSGENEGASVPQDGASVEGER